MPDTDRLFEGLAANKAIQREKSRVYTFVLIVSSIALAVVAGCSRW